ncbi:MAG: hypothetical protein FJZ01_17325 [Candidatus Sericytochromatia bacterium]|nr:hypothetical protein [Candidatus Tanganyikabacteria bacterium]
MSRGGTIFKGSRALKTRERLYLLRRVVMCRGGQILAIAVVAGLGTWSYLAEDGGLGFIAAILAIPAFLGSFYLQRTLAPYARDLWDNKVESIIGAIGGLDLSPGLVKLHLGEDVYYVQAELLRRKRDGEPIMVEFLRHSHLAVAIDGQSNLMSWRRWVELGGEEIG